VGYPRAKNVVHQKTLRLPINEEIITTLDLTRLGKYFAISQLLVSLPFSLALDVSGREE